METFENIFIQFSSQLIFFFNWYLNNFFYHIGRRRNPAFGQPRRERLGSAASEATRPVEESSNTEARVAIGRTRSLRRNRRREGILRDDQTQQACCVSLLPRDLTSLQNRRQAPATSRDETRRNALRQDRRRKVQVSRRATAYCCHANHLSGSRGKDCRLHRWF